jgi:hypothetical protein
MFRRLRKILAQRRDYQREKKWVVKWEVKWSNLKEKLQKYRYRKMKKEILPIQLW